MAILFPEQNLPALWLTVKLASTVTICLLVLGMPLAWWLSQSRAWYRKPIAALVAMPLVLPPSVLGFYFLIGLSPHTALGQFARQWGLQPFTFGGLVLASLAYSLPFMVQPLQTAFEAIGKRPLEVAATLRASPLRAFLTVALPLSLPGLITATVLTFAHTVGEFGVVLMMGGNIPGQTRVASVQLYDYVEALQYDQAHSLAATLLVFSFVVLLALYTFRPETKHAL